MTIRFDGKTALVTAAAQGIGRASALAFAEAGAKVYATDINEAALKEIEGVSGIITRKLNVLDEAEVKAAVAEIGVSISCSTARASSMAAQSLR